MAVAGDLREPGGADEAGHRGGERRHGEQPHGAVLVDGEQEQREAGEPDDGRAPEHESPPPLGHQPDVEEQRQRGARAEEDEEPGARGAVPVAELVDRRRADDQQVDDADDRGGDGRGAGAPGEDHVVGPGPPGRVAGRGDGLAEPGHEGDEQHGREQRGGVADVGLVVDPRRDQPEERTRTGPGRRR